MQYEYIVKYDTNIWFKSLCEQGLDVDQGIYYSTIRSFLNLHKVFTFIFAIEKKKKTNPK